jgi:hypothetical protein
MTKRKNLLKKLSIGVLTLGSGAISLNSLENLPLKDKTDLIVEGYISKIPGDKLSDSFYCAEDRSLLNSVEKKIEKFYDSNFDINVNFSNPCEFDKNTLNKKNVSIE